MEEGKEIKELKDKNIHYKNQIKGCLKGLSEFNEVATQFNVSTRSYSCPESLLAPLKESATKEEIEKENERLKIIYIELMELIAGLRKEIMEGIKKFKQEEKEKEEQKLISKNAKEQNINLKEEKDKLIEVNKKFKINIETDKNNSLKI